VRRPDALLALRLAAPGSDLSAQEIAGWDADRWRAVVPVLRANVVLIRTAERWGGLAGADELRRAAEIERARVSGVLVVVSRLARALDDREVPYVLTKAFQHLPDMGHDVDVLLADRSSRSDRVVATALGARAVRASIVAAFAGKRSYVADGVPIEIHHGRVGHLGEHPALARDLLARRQRVETGAGEAWAPAAEDALLLQALQRVAGHRRIRASDVLRALDLERGGLDEEHLAATARETGLDVALAWYREAVAAIARATGIGTGGAGAGAPRPGPAGHVVPPAVTARSYAAAASAALRRGDLGSLGRAMALPALVAATAVDRTLRRGAGR
jgi:hypothetical protein